MGEVSKLLPCPFCGGDAEVDSYDDRAGTFVECCSCFARVGGGEAEWNTRTASDRAAQWGGGEPVAVLRNLKDSDGGLSTRLRPTGAGLALPLGEHSLYTRPAAEAVGVPDGWRVMWFTGSFQVRGERWEIYGPDGSGGAVNAGDVVDETVSRLLDAMAAAPSQPEGEAASG